MWLPEVKVLELAQTLPYREEGCLTVMLRVDECEVDFIVVSGRLVLVIIL